MKESKDDENIEVEEEEDEEEEDEEGGPSSKEQARRGRSRPRDDRGRDCSRSREGAEGRDKGGDGRDGREGGAGKDSSDKMPSVRGSRCDLTPSVGRLICFCQLLFSSVFFISQPC